MSVVLGTKTETHRGTVTAICGACYKMTCYKMQTHAANYIDVLITKQHPTEYNEIKVGDEIAVTGTPVPSDPNLVLANARIDGRLLNIKLSINAAPVIGDRMWVRQYGWLRVESIVRRSIADGVTHQLLKWGWDISLDAKALCFYADGETVHIQKPVY